jgi:hypothetical protein
LDSTRPGAASRPIISVEEVELWSVNSIKPQNPRLDREVIFVWQRQNPRIAAGIEVRGGEHTSAHFLAYEHNSVKLTKSDFRAALFKLEYSAQNGSTSGSECGVVRVVGA